MLFRSFLDEKGETKNFIMGCYGIGIGRTAAASIEQNHDDNGIIWPIPIAPYSVAVVPVNVSDENQKNAADKLYSELLEAGIDVLLDDRDERAGVKFKDIDLIGIPVKIVIGKTLVDGKVEIGLRKDSKKELVAIDSAVDYIKQIINI